MDNINTIESEQPALWVSGLLSLYLLCKFFARTDFQPTYNMIDHQNAQLKRLLAECVLEVDVLNVVLGKGKRCLTTDCRTGLGDPRPLHSERVRVGGHFACVSLRPITIRRTHERNRPRW